MHAKIIVFKYDTCFAISAKNAYVFGGIGRGRNEMERARQSAKKITRKRACSMLSPYYLDNFIDLSILFLIYSLF